MEHLLAKDNWFNFFFNLQAKRVVNRKQKESKVKMNVAGQ